MNPNSSPPSLVALVSEFIVPEGGAVKKIFEQTVPYPVPTPVFGVDYGRNGLQRYWLS